MSQSDRLVVNSIVMMVRMGMTLLISLLTARLMLQTLGFSDFGILTALGASGFVITIIRSGLNTAALRHLAFEVGRGENGVLRQTFSSTLMVFFGLALVLAAAGVLVKPVVMGLLTIPAERMEAAELVFWFVLGQWAMTAAKTPFNALQQAHQDLKAVALYDLAFKLGVLGLLLLLPFVPYDVLPVIAGGTLVVMVLSGAVQAGHCYLSYPAARPHLRDVRKTEVGRVMHFGKWSMLSMVALELRQQMAVLVVNIQFGAVANGAYSLASRANMFLNQASYAVYSALQPAMTSTHAQEQAEKLQRMISVGCRYSVFVVLPLFVPLILDMPGFLKLWLGEYPPQSPEFARLMMTAGVMILLLNGYGMAMNAVDRVAEPVKIGVPVQIGIFVLSVIGVMILGWPAWTIPVASIFAMLVLLVVYPWRFGKSLGFPVGRWLREVTIPILVITGIGFLCGMLPMLLLAPSILRVLAVSAVSGLAVALATWRIGMRLEERAKLVELGMRSIHRFGLLPNRP